MERKSLLIKDTTVDERMQIVKESLCFGDGECEGVDMDDMYDDYLRQEGTRGDTCGVQSAQRRCRACRERP